MQVTQLVKLNFHRYYVEPGIGEFECKLCHSKFECDTTCAELYAHLKTQHPTLKEFK